MIEQSAVHRGKMQRRGATAAANNPRTTVARQSSILSHQFRCPGVLYLAIDKLWNAAIGLGNENIFVFGMGSHGEQCPHQVGRTHAAVGAKGCQARYSFPVDIHKLRRRYTHHRAPVGIERHGRNNRQS